MKQPARKPWHVPILVSLVVLALVAGGWWLLAGKHIPVLMPSGEIADQQRNLIVFTILLALAVVIPVFSMLIGFSWKYREGNTGVEYKPEWCENKWLEVVWWGIPIAIIVLLATVTYFTSHSLDPYRAIASDKQPVEVQVVALRWKWLFIYPEEKIATINDLTIPVDRPVHFTLSADAPMSAFWIPDLGSQIYSMNAMSSQLNLIANREGAYTGYNTNINGDGYAAMTFKTHAVPDGSYDAWVKQHQASSNMLTFESFKQLAEPNIPKESSYYILHDTGLYDRIVKMKMGHDGAPDQVDDSRPIFDQPDDTVHQMKKSGGSGMNMTHGGTH